MGDIFAKKVKAGITLSGPIEYVKSEPPPLPEPVWVKIKIEHDTKKSPSHVKYL
jgi:hypothetical protein